MNGISACTHYFLKLFSIHLCRLGLWMLGIKVNRQRMYVLCVCEWERGGQRAHISVCFNMGVGRRATLFEHGMLVDPLHNYSSSAEANNGILPLSLCKHKLRSWTMDLGVALLTDVRLSCVCQRRGKNLSCLCGQFYWFTESFSQICHVILVIFPWQRCLSCLLPCV